MCVWSVLLILLGAVALLMLACKLTIRLERKRCSNDFDERQQLFQGRAYGFGLVMGGIYFVILSSFLLIFGDAQFSGDALSLIILAGIMLTVIAVNLYCMMTGALLPLNSVMNPAINLSYTFAALELIGIVSHIWFHGMGMGDDPIGVWEDLTGTVFWVFHAVIYMIARSRDKREADER